MLGVTAGGTWSDTEIDDGGSTVNQTSYALYGYGSYTYRNVYFNASLGAGLGEQDTKRLVFSQNAEGTADTRHLSAEAVLGIEGSYQDFRYAPEIQLGYDAVKTAGYTENGGGIWNLSFEDHVGKSLSLDAGMRLGYLLNHNYGSTLAWMRSGYVHQFERDPYSIDASFAELGGGAFTITENAADRDYISISGGIRSQFFKNTYIDLSYQSALQLEGTTTHGIALVLQQNF